MRRRIRGLLLLGVLAGVLVAGLRRLGVLGTPSCEMRCDCSQAAELCFCGHPTCLAPAGVGAE
jgi:hypothetical protein